MKKICILFLLTMMSAVAFGKGQITVQPMQNITTEKFMMPQIGLGVYEKIGKLGAYNGWVGTGEPIFQMMNQDQNQDLQWFTMKHSLEFYIHRFTIAPGIQFVWDDRGGWSKRNDVMFVKIGYTLWD